MKRTICLLLAALLIFSLSACKEQESSNDFVGVFPVSGYAPSAEDLAAVPYSYSGKTDDFTVTCHVRMASEEEIQLLLMEKVNAINTCESGKKVNPLNSSEYDMLIQKIEQEIETIKQVNSLFLTDMSLIYSGSEETDPLASVTISADGTVYYAFYANLYNTETMSPIMNTADGSYSEGTLLPKKDSYEMVIKYADTEQHLTLSLVQ